MKSAANLVAKPNMISKEQMPSVNNAKLKLNVEPTCRGSGKCCCICEKLANFSMPCLAKRAKPIQTRSTNRAISVFAGIKFNCKIFFISIFFWCNDRVKNTGCMYRAGNTIYR